MFLVTCGWLAHGGLPTHEAVRALGNLTRCDRAARAAVLYGALDALPPLHAHGDFHNLPLSHDTKLFQLFLITFICKV